MSPGVGLRLRNKQFCVSICTLVLVTGNARKIRGPGGAAGMTGPTGARPAFQVSVFVLVYW